MLFSGWVDSGTELSGEVLSGTLVSGVLEGGTLEEGLLVSVEVSGAEDVETGFTFTVNVVVQPL